MRWLTLSTLGEQRTSPVDSKLGAKAKEEMGMWPQQMSSLH